MRNFVLSIVAALAIAVSLLAAPSRAQQVPTTQPFTLTAAGQSSAVIQFSSAISSCGVVVNNGGTFTLVPQSSNDGSTWVTASGINSGSITAVGSYTGGIANTGLLSFRVLLTAVDSTPVTGKIICSNSLARASGGGGGAVDSVTGGTCINAAPTTGAVIVSYTCSTPGPQATPCPIASTGITITAPWPCTISATGGGGSGATYQSYDQMVEADQPSQYVRLASDCSDAITANPGWAATGTPTFGSASLIFDGSLSTAFASTGNYCSVAVNAPDFLWNTYSDPFTIAFWLKYTTIPSTAATIFSSSDPTGNSGAELRVTASTGAVHVVFPGVSDAGAVFTAAANTVYYIALVINPNPYTDGTHNSRPFWQFYENGVKVASGNDVASGNSGSVYSLGASVTGSPGGQGVVIQKVEIYLGRTLSAPRILAHYTGGTTGVYN